MRSPKGGKGPAEDHGVPADQVDEAQNRGDADGLERAVAHPEPDKVSMRAVAEQIVDVIGHRLQDARVRRGSEIGQHLGPQARRDVELLLGRRDEEPVDDGVELVPGYRSAVREAAGHELHVCCRVVRGAGSRVEGLFRREHADPPWDWDADPADGFGVDDLGDAGEINWAWRGWGVS